MFTFLGTVITGIGVLIYNVYKNDKYINGNHSKQADELAKKKLDPNIIHFDMDDKWYR